MRKGILILVAICLFLAMVPAAFAQKDDDWTKNIKWSIGAGGGYSSGDPAAAPLVVSAKLWGDMWEAGGELFSDFSSKSDTYDQIGRAYAAYRYDIMASEDPKAGTSYIGIGIANVFQEWEGLGNSIGPIVIAGWDSDVWGVELKASYHDPIILSGVVYYNFSQKK